MERITSLVHNFARDEEGVTMPEYALMLALIAIVCILAVKFIGQQASTVFNNAGDQLSNAVGG